jgi:two-component system sensor histidine kinase YesM
MERITRAFVFRKQKLIFTVLFVLLFCIFVLVSLLFSSYSQRSIERNTINFMSLINYQIDLQINNAFASIDQVLFAGPLYPDFARTIREARAPGTVQSAERSRKINDFLRLSSWVVPYLHLITFVDNEGEFFGLQGWTPEHQETIRTNIRLLKDSGRNIFVTSTAARNWFESAEREIFSVLCILRDTDTGDRLGYVCVDIDFKDFIQRILSKQTGYQDNHFLVFEDSRFMFSDGDTEFSFSQIAGGKDITGELRSGMRRLLRQSVYRSIIDSDQYLFLMHRNARSGWVLVQYQDMRSIASSTRAAAGLYFGVITVLLLISISFLYILNLLTFRSVRQLIVGMKKVEHGEILPIDNPGSRDSEIGQLIISFNNMANNLRESIYRQYILKTQQKRTELKILQSQINPHFLANTLNLIQSIARADKNRIIPRITGNLIHMFRYSIDGRTEVRIGEEIDHIGKYTEIQELRFPGRCTVNYEIGPGVLDLKMIKFILQPLVENSYYHGIERTSRKGRITVRIAETESNRVCITVEDNGVGIEQGRLEKIREELDVQRDKLNTLDETEGVGIKNVCYRIRDYYGEDYGLEIFSTRGSGTTTKVTIPRQTFESGEAGSS